MKNEKSTAINYIYNLLYQILTIITPFVTAPYTARIFQANGIGVESYISSVTYYFSLFAALGIPVYGQREIARTRDNKEEMSRTFWELLMIRCASTFLSLTIYIVLILNVKENQAFFWVSSITLISGMVDVSWFIMGIENFRILVFRNTIVKLISVVMLFTLIKRGDQLLFFMCLSSGTNLISNLSMWPVVLKCISRVKIKSLNIQKHLKNTLVYFVPTIATSIYTVLDKVMLGILTNGTVENGYYEQANKIINIAKTVLLSLNTVMLPKLSAMYSKGKYAEIQQSVCQSLRFVMLIGIPAGVGIAVASSNFISWFLGNGFEGTIFCLQIMAWLVLIIGISNCLENQYITPLGRKQESNRIVIIGAFINFFLNIIFIPSYGSAGAAGASVIAESVITFLYICLCHKIITFRFLLKISYKNIVASIIMLFVLIVLQRISINPVIITGLQVMVGLITYLVALYVLKDQFMIQCTKRLLEVITNKLKKI